MIYLCIIHLCCTICLLANVTICNGAIYKGICSNLYTSGIVNRFLTISKEWVQRDGSSYPATTIKSPIGDYSQKRGFTSRHLRSSWPDWGASPFPTPTAWGEGETRFPPGLGPLNPTPAAERGPLLPPSGRRVRLLVPSRPLPPHPLYCRLEGRLKTPGDHCSPPHTHTSSLPSPLPNSAVLHPINVWWCTPKWMCVWVRVWLV